MVSVDTGVKIGFSYTLGGTVSSPARSDADPVPPVLESELEVAWDPSERWLRKKRPTTQINYKLYFNRFLDWGDLRFGFKTPAGFLAWAKRQKDGVVVEEAMESFAETQKRSARPTAVSAMKSFLERNGYKGLSKGIVPRYRGQFIKGYTREEIIQLLGYLDNPLQKLYVLMVKDTGFRARTVLSLKWHHLKPDVDAGKQYCHVYLEQKYYEGKKTAGLGFIGPDSLWMLNQLTNDGRVKINPGKCDTTRAEEDKWKCNCACVFPFSYRDIYAILLRANTKAALSDRIQPTHGLRKFFENALDKCEPALDKDKKNQLEGHSLGVRWNYTDQVESLRPLYERAYPHLSLSEDMAADKKVRVLLDQIKALEQRQAGYGDLKLLVDQLTLNQARMMRLLESKFGSEVKALAE